MTYFEPREIESIQRDIQFFLEEARRFRTEMSFSMNEMDRSAEFHHSLYMIKKLRKELKKEMHVRALFQS